jgi:hypothetical protein
MSAKSRKKAPPKTAPSLRTDLIVLVAGKNDSSAIEGILKNPHKLGIRNIGFEIHVHPEFDPGCLHRSAELLRLYLNSHEHALVIFDREGCGKEEKKSREELEKQVVDSLRKNGWEDRAEAIVIDPELENWIWSDSPHVAAELGWKDQKVVLREWLRQNSFLSEEKETKPEKPKEAMEAVLRKVKKPRSSAIYFSIANKVSFERCHDPSFRKLKATLQTWFSPARA